MTFKLDEFTNAEKVFIFATGESLLKITNDEIKGFPVIGCNSVVKKFKIDIWCSAHSNLNDISIQNYINTGNYTYCFFMRKHISPDEKINVDLTNDAKRVLNSAALKKIKWIDIGKYEKDSFAINPFKYEIDLNNPARFSSGLLAIDIAIKLNAKKIVLVGFDYKIKNENIHWYGDKVIDDYQNVKAAEKDYKRLLDLHIKYFNTYNTPPVEYRSDNEMLKDLHNV